VKERVLCFYRSPWNRVSGGGKLVKIHAQARSMPFFHESISHTRCLEIGSALKHCETQSWSVVTEQKYLLDIFTKKKFKRFSSKFKMQTYIFKILLLSTMSFTRKCSFKT
jgi:hypothetical protein